MFVHSSTCLAINWRKARNSYRSFFDPLSFVYSVTLLWILGSASAFSQSATLQSEVKGGNRSAKVTTNDHYAPILINNVMNYYSNAGDGSFAPNMRNNEGFEFPKGSGKTTVSEDGLVWGCIQNGSFEVGGSTYSHGLQAGKILTPGSIGVLPVADDPTLPKYRVYRVRPDVNASTPYQSVQLALWDEQQLMQRSDATATALSIYYQYLADWHEWPASDGAPYNDLNKNGVYDPLVDIPGVPGADQTLWHVSNDMDSLRALVSKHPAPLGLEIQRTIWAYNQTGVLGNAIFLKYKLINKSGTTLDSMTVSQFTDADIGGFEGYWDDFVGCDTTRNLGFIYNARSTDSTYGTTPPAMGMVLLQGPAIPGLPTDSILSDFKWRRGFRSLPMSSFYSILNSTSYDYPGFLSYWYRVLHATMPWTGSPFVDPVTHLVTKFCASGDPVTNSGYVDGIVWPLGVDRKMLEIMGPFSMAAGDTQEVLLVAVVAQGSDRLASVTALKSAVDEVRLAYLNLDPVVSVQHTQDLPSAYSLSQNYPNPFNPSTTIRFDLPARSRVTLRISNVLGQEIATLVNEQKEAGRYTVSWNAISVPSGVYFCRLQAGDFVQTRKIVVLR